MTQTLQKFGKTISYLLASFRHDFHSLMSIFIFSYLRDLKFIVNKQLIEGICYMLSNFDQIQKCHKGSDFVFLIEIYFYQFSQRK